MPHNADIFSSSPAWLSPFALFAHAGWIGVQLFFVLSGFLITGNLIDSRRASNYYSAFYARRVLRIFPLYFVTLIVGLLILPSVLSYSPGALASHANQGWYWTFLSNWSQPFGKEVSGFSHFWSLAVEEQFYLLWPFIIHRMSERGIVVLAAVLGIAALVVRSALLLAHAPHETAYMFTVCRMDALALGAGAAALVRMPAGIAWLRVNRDRLTWLALGLLLVAGALTHEFETYHWTTLSYGQTMLGISFALFLLSLVTERTSGKRSRVVELLSTAPMRSIGRYSFAMYILHVPIANAIDSSSFAPLGQIGKVVYVLTVMVLSYLGGAVSYHLLEKHFLRLKRWFVPRITMPPPPTAPDAATST